MKRHSMGKNHSKQNFRYNATKINRKNTFMPMRGGWRM